MTIERWDPFREMVSLRDAVNSLLQESFVPPTAARPERGTAAYTLPLDVSERENDFVVMASLPGIKPEDVQTTILGDTLTIRGESKADAERKGQNWLLLRAPVRFFPAFGEPGHADQCGEGQCSVRERCPDPDLAEVGAGTSQADQDQRPVGPSRPGHTSMGMDQSVPIWL